MDEGRERELAVLLTLDRSDVVRHVARKLRRAGIPFDIGLSAGPPPRVVISVPRARLDDGRRALAGIAPAPGERGELRPEGRPRSPGSAIAAVVGVFLLHAVLVAAVVGRHPTREHLARVGALVAGRTLEEPWRLLTSVFLHADVPHAFWNGVSMLVFAVPLLAALGWARTSIVYVAGGLCGGWAALITARSGMVFVGSSGAVAALFGAWLTLELVRANRSTLPRRARLRAAGIGLLVLPSLLSPSTASGQPVSVEAHVGGFVAGAVAGALLARISARAHDREMDDRIEPD